MLIFRYHIFQNLLFCKKGNVTGLNHWRMNSVIMHIFLIAKMEWHFSCHHKKRGHLRTTLNHTLGPIGKVHIIGSHLGSSCSMVNGKLAHGATEMFFKCLKFQEKLILSSVRTETYDLH